MADEAISLLLGNTAQRLTGALKVFGKTVMDLEQDIQILRDWIKSQAYLPEVPCDEFIRNMLLMNKFSIENSKQQIDYYYSLRGAIPEMFAERNFRRPHMRMASKTFCFVPLPKWTKEGYRVSIVKFEHNNADDFNACHIVTYVQNFLEIRMLADVMMGDAIICDMSFLTFSHISKMTPTDLKKMFNTEKAYDNIIMEIHFLNLSPVVEKLILLIKQAVGKQIAEGIYAHNSIESLHKHIPKDGLPKEYGGMEYTTAELKEKWENIQERYENRLIELETLRTDESKRPTPLVNHEILGYYGNFKKLNID